MEQTEAFEKWADSDDGQHSMTQHLEENIASDAFAAGWQAAISARDVMGEDEAVEIMVKAMTAGDNGWSDSEVAAYYKLSISAYRALLAAQGGNK